MKAVEHNPCVWERFLHRTDVALPNVGTHGGDTCSDSLWYAQQPGSHGCLEPIRQDRQHVQITGFTLSANDGHKVTMALEECDLVDTQSRKWFERLPLNTLGNPAVENTEQRRIGDIFLDLDIGDGAVDQLKDKMALIGFGMQRI